MAPATSDSPDVPAADSDVRPPNWPIGPGGWDTHAHVFGPVARFPYQPERSYTPPEQGVQAYVAMLDALGVRYGVLVQPSVYGTDNSCLMAALAATPDRLFGVVDLDVLSASDAVIGEMGHAGVLGVRLRWSTASSPAWIARVGARLREIGWHLDLLPENTAALAGAAPHLRALGIPLMIEAMGNPKRGEPADGQDFRALICLLQDGVAWVKLSHAYHIDPGGTPYPGVSPFAKAIIKAAPARCVWGSDWPHPMMRGPMPNDGDLIDLLPEWAGSTDLAARILSDNAQHFYQPSASVR